MKRYYMFLLNFIVVCKHFFCNSFENNPVSVTARSVASMPANIVDVDVALASGITERKVFKTE